MKYLLAPESNSLSHVAKCLSLRMGLLERGHEVVIAIGKRYSSFLDQLGIGHEVLPSIQESDHGGFPSFKWFNKPEFVENCINEEVALIRKIRPDRLVGVFRFSMKASAQIVGVPYDSLICGCMLPESQEVLGYTGDEEEWKSEKKAVDTFFQYAGGKLNKTFSRFGVGGIADAREALKGDRTFLWDFPEFMPLPACTQTTHVGPIQFSQWPNVVDDIDGILDERHPLSIISFGTCMANKIITERITKVLLDLGFNVLIAAGGQKEMLGIMQNETRVKTCSFAPLNQIYPDASLLITHGGQMTVFEALQNKIPVGVLPFQPEQAHNGVCLERSGCGFRLVPSLSFNGDSGVYIEAFLGMSDDDIASRIMGIYSNPVVHDNLDKMKAVISRYRGVDSIVRLLEE